MFHKWVHGVNVSSRKNIELTVYEELHSTVGKGFHCYLNKPKSNKSLKTVELLIDPKDIVMVGEYLFSETPKKEYLVPAIVATKATL